MASFTEILASLEAQEVNGVTDDVLIAAIRKGQDAVNQLLRAQNLSIDSFQDEALVKFLKNEGEDLAKVKQITSCNNEMLKSAGIYTVGF